jgi:RimJ/RimL family protein N-acetyltransferase
MPNDTLNNKPSVNFTSNLNYPSDSVLAKPFRGSLHHDLSLCGSITALEPMQLDHLDELIAAAADGELWTLKVSTIPDANGMRTYIDRAIDQRAKGLELPFVVRRLSDSKIVGTTRYYQIKTVNRNLSIGYTWYSKSVQRTGINTECKLILLQHAFEVAGCISVQWHTHHQNFRSQEAIKRLGASFEGVLRNHLILPDGSIRHTHCFSMLESEWPQSKTFLKSRLAAN